MVFDTAQYTPKSWMNRNRVLHPTHGWQYLSMPLVNSSIHIKIKDAVLKNRMEGAHSMSRKLEHYRKHAPFFRQCMNVFQSAFNLAKDDSLVSLNVACLKSVCKYLDIQFDYRLASELKLDLPTTLGPGQWAPNIARLLEAESYVNPIGGKGIFECSNFSEFEIALFFLEHDELVHECNGYTFEPSLSIIDSMMWMPAKELSEAIHTSYQLVAG